MKTYVITISERFPATHPRKGEPTYFKEKLHNALLWEKGMNVGYSQTPSYAIPGGIQLKLHTLRGNYKRWEKIFEEIDRGEACLVLKQWSGVPYRSKQETIAVLTKEDGIGLQKLYLTDEINLLGEYGIVESTWELFGIPGDSKVSCKELAKNDGLSYEDWNAWFFGKKKNGEPLYDLTEKMAIIHFTSFRY